MKSYEPSPGYWCLLCQSAYVWCRMWSGVRKFAETTYALLIRSGTFCMKWLIAMQNCGCGQSQTLFWWRCWWYLCVFLCEFKWFFVHSSRLTGFFQCLTLLVRLFDLYKLSAKWLVMSRYRRYSTHFIHSLMKCALCISCTRTTRKIILSTFHFFPSRRHGRHQYIVRHCTRDMMAMLD